MVSGDFMGQRMVDLKTMTGRVQKLLSLAMELDPDERVVLAEHLLTTVNDYADLAQEWDSEIQRRIDEMESGRVQGIPWAQVRAEMVDPSRRSTR